MDKTNRLNLNLPGVEDFADIAKLNENFQALDLAALLDQETGMLPEAVVPVSSVDEQLAEAALKGTPADADGMALVESNGAVKRVLWSSVKATLATVFAALNHTHPKSQITDFPASLPASDVYAWAKAASKPGYTAAEVGARPSTWVPTWGEVSGKPGTFPPSAHNHDAGNITSGVLPVGRGGTGQSSLAGLISQLTGQGVAKIATGSYVGTGTYGAANPCSLTFDYKDERYPLFFLRPSTIYPSSWSVRTGGKWTLNNHVTWSGTGLSWHISNDYSTASYDPLSAIYQYNTSGVLYYYLALG